MPIGPITAGTEFEHLVRAMSAKFLHCEVTMIPLQLIYNFVEETQEAV